MDWLALLCLLLLLCYMIDIKLDLLNKIPLFSVLFLLLILANFGLPLSCGFIGEFFCLFAAFSYSAIVGVLSL